MAIATGFETQLSFAEETTYKTAPTGAYQELNQKSSSLSLAFENVSVDRIRGDRNAEDILKGTRSVSGEITCDLSPDSAHNELIAAVFGDSDDIDESGSGSTYTIGSTQRHFTFVNQVMTGRFHEFVGCQINAFSLSVGTSGTIETSFTLMGANMTEETSHVGSSVAPPSAAEIIPFQASDAAVTFNGSGNTVCTEFSLSIDNGMSAMYVVGDDTPIEGHLGKSAVTGSMTVLFASNAEYTRFVNNNKTAIVLTIGTGGTGISFQMPACALTAGTVEIASDGAVTASIEYTALFNSGISSSIRFDNHL